MSNHPSSVSGVFVKPKRPVEFHRPGLQVINQLLASDLMSSYIKVAFLLVLMSLCSN